MVVPRNSLNVTEYILSCIKEMVTLFMCVYVISIVMNVYVLYMYYIYVTYNPKGGHRDFPLSGVPVTVTRHRTDMSYWAGWNLGDLCVELSRLTRQET